MERERKILKKAEQLMEQLKEMTHLERKVVLELLERLIEVDCWLEIDIKELS